MNQRGKGDFMNELTKKHKLIQLINDMEFEPSINYLYAFVIFGMSKEMFPIPKGHIKEVKDYVTDYERDKIKKEGK